jgi:cell division protein FtsB
MTQQVLRSCLFVLVGLLAPLALAQDASPAELRREIEVLREQNAEIAAERDELLEHVTALRDEMISISNKLEVALNEIKELKRLLASKAEPERVDEEEVHESAPEVVTPRGAPIPNDHLASPESLLRALVHAYGVRFPNPILETDQDRKRFETRVRKWTQDVSKTMRGQTTWRVLLTDITPRRRGRETQAMMAVLDPASGLTIGTPFLVEVPSRMALKLGAEKEQVYDLSLMLVPSPMVNPKRLVGGVFDWPPYVGPMVDFAFDIEWMGLRRYEPAAETSESESEAGSADGP